MGICNGKPAATDANAVALDKTTNPASKEKGTKEKGQDVLASIGGSNNLAEGLKKTTTTESTSGARARTSIAIAAGTTKLKKATTTEKGNDLAAQLAGEKEKIGLTEEDQNLMNSIEGPHDNLKKTVTKESTVGARDKTAMAIASGNVKLNKAETTEKQADLSAQLASEKDRADLTGEDRKLMNSIEGGGAGLRKTSTIDTSNTIIAREMTTLAITKEEPNLKKVTTVERSADLAAQLASEKATIGLNEEDQSLMKSIMEGVTLKKTNKPVQDASVSIARALNTLAVSKGVVLKKAETVFKEADLKAQLDGFKEVAALSDDDKKLFSEITEQVLTLKKAETKVSGGVSALDRAILGIASGTTPKLKETTTVVKEATLKDQLDGFKTNAALSKEDTELMGAILKGIKLRASVKVE